MNKTVVYHVNCVPDNIPQSDIVYCGRGKYGPGRLGNKYIVGVHGTREECVAKHRLDTLSNPDLILWIKNNLTNKALTCFCKHPTKPLPCHCDVYAQIANGEINV